MSDDAGSRLKAEITAALQNDGVLSAELRVAVQDFVDECETAGQSAEQVITTVKSFACGMGLPSIDEQSTVPDSPTAWWIMRHVLLWAVNRHYQIDENAALPSRSKDKA